MIGAFRNLWRSPGFALFSILSIGIGVGACAAMFSLTEQALLRLLPVEEPERLALLSWQGRFVGSSSGGGDLASYPFYKELAETNEVFDAVFARQPATVHFSDGEATEEVPAEYVTGTYFPTLGVRPELGRIIEPSDDLDAAGEPPVVVSFDFWRNRLGGDPSVVGRRVRVNGNPMTVAGVAMDGFYGVDWGAAPALWVPVTAMRNELTDRRSRRLNVFGRLKRGVTLEQAQASLQPWFKGMLQADTEREGWPRVTENTKQQYLASTLAVLPGARGRSDARGQVQQPWRRRYRSGASRVMVRQTLRSLAKSPKHE